MTVQEFKPTDAMVSPRGVLLLADETQMVRVPLGITVMEADKLANPELASHGFYVHGQIATPAQLAWLVNNPMPTTVRITRDDTGAIVRCELA